MKYRQQQQLLKSAINLPNPEFFWESPTGNFYTGSITQSFEFPTVYGKQVQLQKQQVVIAEKDKFRTEKEVSYRIHLLYLAIQYTDALQKELKILQQNLEKHQAELNESLHQAATDPLTGLLNRRAFDEKLNRAFHHAMRQKNTPLSLVLLDLDHFKNNNDQFGHQTGELLTLPTFEHRKPFEIRVREGLDDVPGQVERVTLTRQTVVDHSG